MRVIVIPADPGQPCTAVTVPDGRWPGTLELLVGEPADRAVYDYDAALWVHGDGAATLPANQRATEYAFGHSAAAARNRTDPADPPYWLHGTVIITGTAADGGATDVPARLYAHFGLEHDDPAGPGGMA
jgi:hypothetical protein